jgi:hypothetical protein
MSYDKIKEKKKRRNDGTINKNLQERQEPKQGTKN